MGFGPGATPFQTVTPQDILDDIAVVGASRVSGLFDGVGNLGSSLNSSAGDAAYEDNTFFGTQFEFLSGDNLPSPTASIPSAAQTSTPPAEAGTDATSPSSSPAPRL